MKSNFKDWVLLALVIAGIGYLIYSVYGISGDPETAKWMAKPFSEASMRDVLGTGCIIATLHAILAR